MVGQNRISASYRYCPYLCNAIFGSSASLKSSSNPRFCRDLKYKECEDLIPTSSSKTRIRRSVGFSGEKELQSTGRNEIRAIEISSLPVIAITRVYELQHCIGLVITSEEGGDENAMCRVDRFHNSPPRMRLTVDP